MSIISPAPQLLRASGLGHRFASTPKRIQRPVAAAVRHTNPRSFGTSFRMSKVHAVAASGFGTGTNELYDRARPSYPPAALAHIHSSIPPAAHGRGLKILEPGAGTGIFTRLLLSPPSSRIGSNGMAGPIDSKSVLGQSEEYPTWNIDCLVSVEPSEGMRGAWEKGIEKIKASSPDALGEGRKIAIVDGVFDDFSAVSKLAQGGIGEGEADLIVIAQAWHWCPDHQAAFKQIAKHLSPDGILVFVWNLESGGNAITRRVRDLFEPFDLGTPQYYKMQWRKGFEVPAYGELFQPPEEQTFRWDRGVDDQGVIDRVLSKSYLTEAHLNGEEREKFISDLKGLLNGVESEKDYIDKERGIYRFHYQTDVVVMRKK